VLAQSVFFMSLNNLLLRTVHENVHDFKMIQPYSNPKIYTGGVDILGWSKLSKAQKSDALSKEWYVYYSYRDPKSDRLKRQPNIKAGANRYKTKSERLSFLRVMQQSLSDLLRAGFNPYSDNSLLEKQFFGKDIPEEKPAISNQNQTEEQPKLDENKVVETELEVILVSEAFKKGLQIKKSTLGTSTFTRYLSRINQFEKWLIEKKLADKPITDITKKIVIEYLNSVLETTSARNRNNARGVISSLFNTLEDNEIIPENFVKKIYVLKAKTKRNKTYTPKQEKDIYEYMGQYDPILLLFVQFVSYNFLRPIEVCRLTIEDIDIEDRKIYLKAKNKLVKIKIIPEMLLSKIPDLSKISKKYFLFTPDKIGGEWDADENNKRDRFSKRFKVVKDHFGLGVDYGLYSFRHTFITKLYREIRKDYSVFESKSRLMSITGHTTMVALEQYLRDIDAELPEDYSVLLKRE